MTGTVDGAGSAATGLAFPFAVSAGGTILAAGDRDADLRARILQVLFTTPGERVNQPEFGCGLFNLVFEPVDTVLLAALEFTVGQALTRWLGNDLVVADVSVHQVEGSVLADVAYVRRSDLARQSVRFHFS